MGASLLFTTPIDAPGGTTERRLPLHGPRPGPPQKCPKEFPASGREFLGPKFARPPAGRKNAPAFGRGRLVVSEYAGKKRFLHRKMAIFKKNTILVPRTTEIDLGTLIFGFSASNYMGSRSSRPNPCPEDPFRGQSKVPPKAG